MRYKTALLDLFLMSWLFLPIFYILKLKSRLLIFRAACMSPKGCYPKSEHTNIYCKVSSLSYINSTVSGLVLIFAQSEASLRCHQFPTNA